MLANIKEATKQLVSVAPRFIKDEDEEWHRFISGEVQAMIRDERLKYHNLVEKIDNIPLEMDKLLVQKPSEEEKKKKKDELSLKRKKLRHQLLGMTKNLVTLLTECRTQGLEAKRKRDRQLDDELAAAHDKEPHHKKHKPHIAEYDSDLEADDYMPRWENNLKNISKDKIPVTQHLETNMTDSRESDDCGNDDVANEEALPSHIENLITNVDPEDAEVLLQLSSFIEQYQCKERALKSAQTYRKARKMLECLERVTSYIASNKK